ncbi:MAG: hypothetical protein ABI137_14810 [Antricoccus sp.]
MSVKPRCKWCSRQIIDDLSTGRRKQYCSQACRQRAYEKRREQTLGLPHDPEAVVINRVQMEYLQDRLYILRCAIEDLSLAMADGDHAGTLIVATEVVHAAGDLDTLWVTP